MTKRMLTGLMIVGLLSLATGCVTTPTRAEIPLGKWTGHGQYVAAKWATDAGKPATPATVEQGSYPTELTIEPAVVGGKDGLRIEILSQRGKMKLLEGDRTHIVALLRKVQSVAGGKTTLYEVAERGVSLNEKPPKLEKQGPPGALLATCMLADGATVLWLHYDDGYVDVFRFYSSTLLKDGTYFDVKSGLVDWSELLRRER